MPSGAKILPNYSYEDYCHWDGRWEIIDGIPYAMSPMPSPRHQAIAANLNAEFLRCIDNAKCDCTVYQPIDVKITENTVVNPDVLIVCNPIKKQYLDFAPELVVEILSPSTVLKDRHTKSELYEDFGVQYYLIIDPITEEIEVYQLVRGKYVLVDTSTPFRLNDGCTISPNFEYIWR